VSTATAGTRAPTRSPRRHLLITLVAISVALNLFFIAGALWTWLQAPSGRAAPDQRYEQMAAELKLDAQQRPAFDRYVAAMRSRVDEMRQQVDPLIGSAWEEVAKPQADPARVNELFDQATEKRRAFQRDLTTQTLAFLAVLSPEQRSKFVAMARERRAPWFRSNRQSR
jgi:uncharacterized membrane protein